MPIINLKMRSGKGMEWWVVVSGMPSENVETLQILKPQSNIVSSYDYRPVEKYLGQGAKKYFTLTWNELSTDTTAPVVNLNPVFNLLDDLGYRVVASNAMGADSKSGDYKFIVWTFQKNKRIFCCTPSPRFYHEYTEIDDLECYDYDYSYKVDTPEVFHPPKNTMHNGKAHGVDVPN